MVLGAQEGDRQGVLYERKHLGRGSATGKGNTGTVFVETESGREGPEIEAERLMESTGCRQLAPEAEKGRARGE